jgi:CRISPR/Cas system-associated exonuclease Cas4 (RecB family)
MTDYSKIYSYSKIESFNKCKQQYYFNYLDPEIAPIKRQFIKPRDYKTKGSAVHGAITLFYYLDSKKRTFSNLKKCLEKAWFSEIDAFKKPPLGEAGGFKDLKHERKIYMDSLKLLHNFYEMDEKLDLFYFPVKTIKNSFEDYEKMIKPIDKDISISGKFDRIDKVKDGLRVVDFKTGRSKNGFSQLEFYKLLAELNFNEKVNQVSYYYLNDKKIQNYDVINSDIKIIKEKVIDKIKNIRETKKFPPSPDALCNHCDFKEICPNFK